MTSGATPCFLKLEHVSTLQTEQSQWIFVCQCPIVKPRCGLWVLSKAAAGPGHFRFHLRAGHRWALPCCRHLGRAAALSQKGNATSSWLCLGREEPSHAQEAPMWHPRGSSSPGEGGGWPWRCFFQSAVCLSFIIILVWSIYPLCLPQTVSTITTKDQVCHSKILPKKKKKKVHDSQDMCKCRLNPNTSPDSETLSVMCCTTLSPESKGEHFRVSCWKTFLVCACSVRVFVNKTKGVTYF